MYIRPSQFVKRAIDLEILMCWIERELQSGSRHRAVKINRAREEMKKRQCQSQ